MAGAPGYPGDMESGAPFAAQTPPPRAQAGGERRRLERRALCAYVELFDPGGAPLEINPDVLDIHEQGLRLRLGAPLERGSRLRFLIRLSQGEVRGEATVRWTQPFGLAYVCGASITELGWMSRWRLRRHFAYYAGVLRLLDLAMIWAAVGLAILFLYNLNRGG